MGDPFVFAWFVEPAMVIYFKMSRLQGYFFYNTNGD